MSNASRQDQRRAAGAAYVPVRLLVGIAVVVWALPALAGGGDQTSKVETFRQHVAEGAKLRKAKKYRQALEHFDEARAIADHPKLMWVTAQLHAQIGDCPGAREDFEQALDDKRTSSKLHAKLEEALEANKQCQSRGTIVVECTPAEVQLRVGERQMACGEEVELEAGTHTLVASADGHSDAEVEVSVEPGGEHTRPIELAEAAPGAKPVAQVPAWMTYTAYGGMGVGSTLLLAGIISDAAATGRQEDLHQAHMQGQLDRTNRLVQEAESAQTRTAVLYTSGVLLATAGGLLWIYDEEAAHWLVGEEDARVQPEVSVGADGASLGATIRW